MVQFNSQFSNIFQANFLLLIILLLFGSALAIKAALFPDLSASPGVMGETFGWTFQQLFTTDLGKSKEGREWENSRIFVKQFCANPANAIVNYCLKSVHFARPLAAMPIPDAPPNICSPHSPFFTIFSFSNSSHGQFCLPFLREQQSGLKKRRIKFGDFNFMNWPQGSGE